MSICCKSFSESCSACNANPSSCLLLLLNIRNVGDTGRIVALRWGSSWKMKLGGEGPQFNSFLPPGPKPYDKHTIFG